MFSTIGNWYFKNSGNRVFRRHPTRGRKGEKKGRDFHFQKMEFSVSQNADDLRGTTHAR